jgi:uncharacterized membrane protein YcjF (UPF0283 family)
MLVLASTVVTILIVVAIVVVVGVLFVALGPLSRREQERDDLGADMGPFGTARLDRPQTREELGDDAGQFSPDAEERLDERNE